MASWQEIEKEVPELAGRVRELLDAHRHKTMATLRRDGSPRISGTEAQFKDGEHLVIQMRHEGRGFREVRRR
ncbi:hypothetical protein [Planomonospora parontospora]|nr:hypothetical protein [Planomonospora parontospora]